MPFANLRHVISMCFHAQTHDIGCNNGTAQYQRKAGLRSVHMHTADSTHQATIDSLPFEHTPDLLNCTLSQMSTCSAGGSAIIVHSVAGSMHGVGGRTWGTVLRPVVFLIDSSSCS